MAVLATLFLLSYAKLLRSIINPSFVITLEYPSDSKKVWLVDGNVPYLKGKHIPLFLISLLALFRTLHSLHFAAATGTMDSILI